jgi:hypothetical protein
LFVGYRHLAWYTARGAQATVAREGVTGGQVLVPQVMALVEVHERHLPSQVPCRMERMGESVMMLFGTNRDQVLTLNSNVRCQSNSRHFQAFELSRMRHRCCRCTTATLRTQLRHSRRSHTRWQIWVLSPSQFFPHEAQSMFSWPSREEMCVCRSQLVEV